ncbi:hypothetical protein LRP49_02440 [Enterovibrio sp. ZSDZ35]|uniref:Ferredoxin-NADP reductase n=1 Tax=Enterovibrio qingdaonensis TaxID=2899818 RepID=A0ABT5QGD8_9GAMM|nr:hypothetical protein [Enterovibrio sp. ZSDZ35]MDD1780047.1 hypothetical protein [Enterovibrio sp. ZSDZ35]
MMLPYTDVQLPQKQPALRRIWKYPVLEHYVRLIILVSSVNIAWLIYGLTDGGWFTASHVDLASLSNAVIGNFFIAVIVRQQYTINLLFRLATLAPVTWPLAVRWHLGKVYHHGGLHSGSAVNGTLWFFLFSGGLIYQHHENAAEISTVTLWSTVIINALLVIMIAMAMPTIRRKFHNAFEATHRFAGWFILILFWIQTVSLAKNIKPTDDIWTTVLQTPACWLLGIMTFSILLPWLRLRKVPVRIDTPSKHVALLKFDYGVTPFAGSSMAISRSPLMEWHHFANVPSPTESGYRLTVSRAGDWTGRLIDDKPSHLWVKGIPTAGVANIEVLFKRVVYIATGSGIGPCLPHLLAQKLPMLLVWSTRDPRKTYGDKLVDEILAAQPDAIIWDTDKDGKPDMVHLAYAAYQSFDAEAVICISNQKLTRQVVFGMESRGIPAFGAIWDS